jgi:hypothetical protein
MTGVVVVNGAGALNTAIEALSAVGARYFGARRDELGVVLLQCMTHVTDDVPFAVGAGVVPGMPGLMEPPPPPPHAANSITAPAAPTRRTKTRDHENLDSIRIASLLAGLRSGRPRKRAFGS